MIKGSRMINSTIFSTPLKEVTSHKHRGVTISNHLSWKTHVLSAAVKANRVLGSLDALRL